MSKDKDQYAGMSRKALIEENKQLRAVIERRIPEQRIDYEDARSFRVLRVRYRLMTGRLRKRIKKQDPIFHGTMTNPRLGDAVNK